jgi:hypothetical protein
MKSIFYLILLVGALFSGCAIETKVVYDKEANFGAYKTFCWMEGCDVSGPGSVFISDTLIQTRLKRAVLNELNKKNLVNSSVEPDLLVAVSVILKDQSALPYLRADDVPFFWPADVDMQEKDYVKGTVVIAMADRRTGRMVWECIGVRYMELYPNLSERNFRKAVRILMKKFPPKSVS